MEVAAVLGIEETNPPKIDTITAVAMKKRITVESLLVYGASPGQRNGDKCLRVPVYNEKGETHSHFDLGLRGKLLKGMFKAGKGSSGLFFPKRLPATGETWIVCEGCKDACAYHALGFLACGLPTDQMAAKYARLFRGVDVIVMPDRSKAAESKAQLTAGRLVGVAKSVRVGVLPLPIDGSEGDDCRDVLRKPDGEKLLRQAIEDATKPAATGTSDSKPTVWVTLDEAQVAAEVLRHLGGSGLYQRSGCLVHVSREPSPPNARVVVPGSLPRIRHLPASLLRETITAAVDLVTRGDGEDKPTRPHKWLVDALHQRGQYPSETIPPLVGIVRCPTIRPDGTVLQEPGYDARSGLLYDPDGEYPTVPDAPTLEQASQAAAELLEVIQDFPFMAEEHRSVWLALLLTLVGRSAIPGPCPLFAVDANTRGSGKSLMCDAAGVIAFGDQLPRKTWSRDDDETRKTITSIALEAVPAVLLDNVSSTLGSASLDAVLTGTSWTDRILGKSQTTGTLPLTAVWIATGNNLVLGADTARRSLYCRLETLEEHPEDREDFRHRDLLRWVRENRHRLAVHAVTVLRAYLAAGTPKQSLKSWGSFQAWSDLIRGAIVWIGRPDPAHTKMIVRDADRTTELLGMLLEGVTEADTGNGVTAGELAKLVQHPLRVDDHDPYPALRAAVTELCGSKVDARQLGYKLRSYADRVCGGRRLVRREVHTGIKRWSVEPVDGGDVGHGGDPTLPSRARARARAHARDRDARETSPPSPPSPPHCNHTDSETWERRGGKAFCPGCGKFMGRVTT